MIAILDYISRSTSWISYAITKPDPNRICFNLQSNIASTIDTIITCRLEKYRSLTEEWLRQHNIRYNNLIMLNLPSRESRLSWGRHGEYKGEYYKNSSNNLVIESSFAQAQLIASITRKPVICIESNKLVSPPPIPIHGKKVRRWLKRKMPNAYSYLKKITNRQ